MSLTTYLKVLMHVDGIEIRAWQTGDRLLAVEKRVDQHQLVVRRLFYHIVSQPLMPQTHPLTHPCMMHMQKT